MLRLSQSLISQSQNAAFYCSDQIDIRAQIVLKGYEPMTDHVEDSRTLQELLYKSSIILLLNFLFLQNQTSFHHSSQLN